jgi:hypothetical protein
MEYKMSSETIWEIIGFTLVGKSFSCFGKKMQAYQRDYLCGLLFILAFFAFVSAVSAQPAMSRGEQLLPISYDECIRRAERAYTDEGWVNIGKGGAYVNAFKENNGAYIMCNVAPENKIWVNIVVASSSGDSGVPGSERVKLQGRMGQSSASVAGCGLGRTWSDTESGISQTWTRRGSSDVFDVSGMINGSPFTAEQTIEIKGNKVFINRYKAGDGNTCTFEGTIQSDGVTVTGSYDCTRFKPSSGWRAVINCD